MASILSTIQLETTSTSGTLTSEQLATLQESKTNYIVYGTELFKLVDNNTSGDTLIYTCSTNDSGTLKVKSITVTISTLAWELMSLSVSNATKELTLTESGNVLTSTETFTTHTQILVEFETDGIYAGFDCILHPYDQAICMVTYNVLTNDTPHFGTCYLDNTGHVVVNVPTGMTFTNVKAHYIALE